MAYRIRQLAFILFFVAATFSSLSAATLPAGFTETQITGLSNSTAMAFAPDGRLFVCQQTGQLRVIKNNALLTTPFLTVTVNSSGERGLLGIAFDPNFNANHYIYIYYTATTPAAHNRVSRFTANGDVALASSETVLLDLNDLSTATNHNGGAMHFGTDGKLYIAVGENANSANAQSFANLLGKILRINTDPNNIIPTDNPFYNDPNVTGQNKIIWALGLRNPYTFNFQPGTGRMFINDVGQGTTEEINDGIAGSNYGWPSCEGTCTKAGFRNPIYTYNHSTGTPTGCAITGGTFYNPVTQQFPDAYVGKYFFADYCTSFIRYIDPAAPATSNEFATNASSPVDLQVAADGSFWYLARGTGSVWRIQYTANQVPPTITQQPQNQTVAAGQTATFTASATGSTPLTFQWQRNGVDIGGANASSYTTTPASSADNGAVFRVVVKNAFGTATSNNVTLTVTANTAPTATITAPASGTLYTAGQTINFAGTGTDAEDGTLAASAFTWRVDFQHDTHAHPFVPATTNIKNGSFTTSTTGETSANVWYRIYLTVTDSGGLSQTVTRDVFPRKANITLATNPAGLQITLDGQPQTAPVTVQGVVGFIRSLGVVSPQTVNGVTYDFTSWSDGGGITHDISTPASDTIYTANFTARQTPPAPVALQFNAASYRVSEGGASATINVSRTGDTTSVVTVDYQTSDNTASQRTDYTIASGTLTFAAGETTKSFVVLITENGRVDGDRTINLTLTNPSGGATLGAGRTAVLTINDNDATPSTTNPIDDTGDFVRQHYFDFLNRQPDAGGFAYWTNLIGQCNSTDAQCLNSKRVSVSAAFFIEQEFQDTGSYVYRFYKAAYGQRPTYAQFMPDRSRVVGGANLETGKQAFAEAFVLRPDFIAKYPATLSPAGFVDALLQTLQQSSAVDLSGQRDALINDYTVNKNRARILRQIVDDASFKAAEYNKAFVLMQYFGYLRRDPDASGYQFWLDVLNNRVPNNYRSMVCAFITSAEYQDRFSSIRTRNDSVCGQIGQ